MDKDRLVNEIVTEVLKGLSNVNTVNDRVHVVGELPIHYDTHGLECVSITKNYHKGEPILITQLTPNMLANLANGQATTKEEEYILYNLLHGFDVYMLEDGFEYQGYRKTAYKALYSLYRDYDDKLRNYGLKIQRLKTGTPQRIAKDSIDYSKLSIENGDDILRTFSYDVSPIYKIEDGALKKCVEKCPLSGDYSFMIKTTSPKECVSSCPTGTYEDGNRCLVSCKLSSNNKLFGSK